MFGDSFRLETAGLPITESKKSTVADDFLDMTETNSSAERMLVCEHRNGVLNYLDAETRASECRVRAANAAGDLREKYLNLAYEYDLIGASLRRIQATQLRLSGEEPLFEISEDKQSDA